MNRQIVYVFTADGGENGREVIAVLDAEPDEKQMWQLLEEYLRAVIEVDDPDAVDAYKPYLNQYSADEFTVHTEEVRKLL